jgi:hypothetical protein
MGTLDEAFALRGGMVAGHHLASTGFAFASRGTGTAISTGEGQSATAAKNAATLKYP